MATDIKNKSKRAKHSAAPKSAKRKGTQDAHAPYAEDDTIAKAPNVSPAQYIRNVKGEMAKVIWPTRKETIQSTIMVIIMVVFVSLFLFSIDTFFAWAVEKII